MALHPHHVQRDRMKSFSSHRCCRSGNRQLPSCCNLDSSSLQQSLPRFGYVSIGAHLNDHKKPVPISRFKRKVSRFNIWNRLQNTLFEIPSQFRSCKNAPVIFNGLLLRWTGWTRAQQIRKYNSYRHFLSHQSDEAMQTCRSFQPSFRWIRQHDVLMDVIRFR